MQKITRKTENFQQYIKWITKIGHGGAVCKKGVRKKKIVTN
jgi:hypothetical protein